MMRLWELFINFTESGLMLLLFNQKLQRKEIRHTYIKQIFYLIIKSILLHIANQYTTTSLVVMLVYIAICYLYETIFFSSKNTEKVFWLMVYMIATMTADALTTMIPTRLFGYELQVALIGGSLRVPFTLTYIIMLSIAIMIMLCFTTKNFQLKLSEKIIFVALSLLCLSIEELILMEQLAENTLNNKNHGTLIFLIFYLVMALFIILVFFTYHLGIEREKNIKITELHLVSQMEKKQYEQIIQSVYDLRNLKHDLSNHLKTIQAMLEQQHYTEATNYIHSLTGCTKTSYQSISSGYTAIDCIVTNKLNLAATTGISVNHTIHLSEKLPLSDMDICSLIGNLFDNAIESCNKDGVTDKYITFTMKPYNQMLSIQMINPSNGIYLTNHHGELITTKTGTDCYSHGLGLKRIRSIVNEHHGFIDIKPETSTFRVSILIPYDYTNQQEV